MAERENGGHSILAFITGAAIGALVGAAVALLTAPQSGRESREDMKEAMNKLTKRTEELAGKVKEATTGFVSEKKKMLGKAAQAYREGKQAAEEELEES